MIHPYWQVLACIAALMGSFLAMRGLYRVYEAANHGSWNTTKGRVTSTEVERVNNDGYEYIPKVTYLFDEQGEIYQKSERIQFTEYDGTTEKEAHKILESYPQNGSVTVYFHPRDPRRSTLQPGNSQGGWGSVISGIFLVGIAIWTLLGPY
jgi:hypothetical protein